MSTEYKLTKGQALVAILEEERAEALDAELAAMSKEEKIEAIEAAGISREEQAAFFAKQQQKILAAIERQPAPENVVPIRKDVGAPATPAPARKKRWFGPRDAVFMASGGGMVSVAAGVIMRIAATTAPVLPPLSWAASVPPPTPEEVIRHKAYEECGLGRYEVCLEYLDRARELDPYGDQLNDAMTARDIATKGLNKKP